MEADRYAVYDEMFGERLKEGNGKDAPEAE